MTNEEAIDIRKEAMKSMWMFQGSKFSKQDFLDAFSYAISLMEEQKPNPVDHFAKVAEILGQFDFCGPLGMTIDSELDNEEEPNATGAFKKEEIRCDFRPCVHNTTKYDGDYGSCLLENAAEKECYYFSLCQQLTKTRE